MDMQAPEKRICSSCKNVLTLNLFSLNGDICRYCEKGIEVPNRLRNEPIPEIIPSSIPDKEEGLT